MASMLPPPLPASYSLRVQLFAPTAYSTDDKPLRSFRVVTNPEISIRDFCEDASRRHEGMYGSAFAVKRCQDDQGFDLMQTDILGTLFSNGATIRIVQAHTLPNIRDSVPPTSALRFEPTNVSGTKRGRPDSSPKRNGILPPSSYQASKRQRLADFDPDHPLPSLEEEAPQEVAVSGTHIIPNSQESVDLGKHIERADRPQVRSGFLRLFAQTPPPLLSSPACSSVDTFRDKSRRTRADPFKEIPESSPILARVRSESSQLRRSEERSARTSHSLQPITAALSTTVEVQIPSKRLIETGRVEKTRRIGGGKSATERDDIYDQMPEDEGLDILKAKKAELSRRRQSPGGGRIGTPTRVQQNLRSQWTPGELPLTPNSRREAQRQRQEPGTKDSALNPQTPMNSVGLSKKDASALRKQSLRTGSLDSLEQAGLLGDPAISKEREDREASDQQIADGLAEAERVLSEDGQIDPPEPEKLPGLIVPPIKTSQPTTSAIESSASASPLETRQRQTSSPILPRASSALSSTPFIPAGRKSALKPSPVRNGPPALQSPSAGGVGIEQNMPLPKHRKVSFHGVPEDQHTPSKPNVKPTQPVTPHPRTDKTVSAPNSDNRSTSSSEAPSSVKSKSITPDISRTKTATPSTESSSRFTPQPSSVSGAKNSRPNDKPTASITPVPQPIRPQSASKPNLQVARSSTGAIIPNGRSTPVPVKAAEPAYKRLMREKEEHKRKSKSPSSSAKPNSSKNVKRQTGTPRKDVRDTSKPVVPLSSKASSSLLASNAKARSASVEPKRVLSSDKVEDSSGGEDDKASSQGGKSTSLGSASESEDEEADEGESSGVRTLPKQSPLRSVGGKTRATTANPSALPKTLVQPAPTKKTKGSNDDESSSSDLESDSDEEVESGKIIPESSLNASASVSDNKSVTKSPILSQAAPQVLKQGSINEADIETQSYNSSSRDSRSPVIYNQQEELPKLTAPEAQAEKLGGAQSEESEDDDSSSSSGDDVDMEDEQTPVAKAKSRSTSESVQEDTVMADITSTIDATQDLESEPPSSDLPRPRRESSSSSKSTSSRPRSILKQPSNSKTQFSYSSPCGSGDTQEEVDFQLISSLNEDHPSSSLASQSAVRPSSTAPTPGRPKPALPNGKHSISSPAPPAKPPQFGYGASLSGLNAAKSVPVSSTPARTNANALNGATKPGVKLKSTRGGNVDYDDSEEDTEDNDSDDESDSDEAPSQPVAKLPRQPPAFKTASGWKSVNGNRSNQPLKSSSVGKDNDMDESSDSSDDSGSESDDALIKAKRNLQYQLSQLSQGTQRSVSSSQSPALNRKNRLKR